MELFLLFLTMSLTLENSVRSYAMLEKVMRGDFKGFPRFEAS